MTAPMTGEILSTADRTAPAWIDRLARRALFARLSELREGEIVWREAGQPPQRFGPAGARADRHGEANLAAEVTVHSPSAYRAIAFGGTVGAADAFTAGLWSSPDLVSLIRLLARQRELHARIDSGWAWAVSLARKVAHAARANSRSGSRRNIAAHYDLGNDFFAQILDPTLSYSCALFESPDSSLEAASLAKIDLICRKLELGRDDELLEIGTGWGALAIHAASHYGCRVTTTTISPSQFALAATRIAEVGLSDRITLLAVDYRDLPLLGRKFDKVVSVEMIEAVGERFLDAFLSTVGLMLEDDGRALVQAITVPDRLFADYRKGADFIQRRIFPGSFLPAMADLLTRAGRVTDLSLVDVEELTPHYATTLRCWRENLLARR
ncbi:MAG: cyclopropane-fatty-acyl-phospholipid synthase family protein, partial [Thermoanaerobaculia bacterium]